MHQNLIKINVFCTAMTMFLKFNGLIFMKTCRFMTSVDNINLWKIFSTEEIPMSYLCLLGAPLIVWIIFLLILARIIQCSNADLGMDMMKIVRTVTCNSTLLVCAFPL